MSSILSHIEENPQDTQRLIGLRYPELQQLIQNAKRLHDEKDDTFRRVFEFIDPEALNRCFLKWVETLVTNMGGEIIPIDGKTIRGSYD